jgi:hypothetical protein
MGVGTRDLCIGIRFNRDIAVRLSKLLLFVPDWSIYILKSSMTRQKVVIYHGKERVAIKDAVGKPIVGLTYETEDGRFVSITKLASSIPKQLSYFCTYE